MTSKTFSFFSIEIYDPELGSVVHEVYLEKFESQQLPEFIQNKMLTLAGRQSENIDRNTLMVLPVFSKEINIYENLPVRIRHEVSVLPYRVHGGREVDLLRKASKPLAVFSNVDPSSKLASFIHRHLQPLVDSHKLIAGEISEPSQRPTLLYALPNEVWRIEAYRLMKSTARACGWSDALERIEGSLLGYTSEQNDSYMEYRKRRGYRWGRQAVYSFLSNAELDFVRKTGDKALPIEERTFFQLYLPYCVNEEYDIVDILRKYNKNTMIRFFIQIIKFNNFPKMRTKISDVEFELFELHGSDVIFLNRMIDGAIEIIE